MKGYFSQLIQQTGITVGSVDVHSQRSHKPSPMPEEHDTTTPIHVEENIVIPSQEDRAPEEISEYTRGNSSPSVADIPAEEVNIQHVKQERIEVSEERQSVSEERPLTMGKDKLEKRRSVRTEKAIQPFSELSGIHHKPDSQESLEQKDKDATSKDDAQYQETSFVPEKHIPEDKPAGQSDLKSDDRIISKERILQSTLREVREWVAETPDREETRNRTASTIDRTASTIDIERVTPDSLDRREMMSSQPTEPRQKEELGIHNLHLSIGTITLTIEEPQQTVQPSEPRRRTARKTTQERTPSRVSRHYIRMR